MSYLHCPACKCAYNIVHHPACPSCRARPGALAHPADPTDDVVDAAEQLARAIARATPAQLAAAEQRLAATPLRAVRAALAPEPPPEAHQTLLAAVAIALLTRLTSPRGSLIARARAWLR